MKKFSHLSGSTLFSEQLVAPLKIGAAIPEASLQHGEARDKIPKKMKRRVIERGPDLYDVLDDVVKRLIRTSSL